MTVIEPRVASVDARLVALESGTAAQRELAELARRVIDLASGAAIPTADDGFASRSRFAEAVRGVDAVESIASAVAAARARLIDDAYAHAHEDLSDPARSPGDVIEHADGALDHAMTRTQITSAALGAVLHITPGAAARIVSESVRLASHMPNTLELLSAGELSTYGQYLVASATSGITPEQASAFDALFTESPLADPVLDLATGEIDSSPGAHRAAAREVRQRIDCVARRLGLDHARRAQRRAGFAGRHVRFGRSTDDGMTTLHGSLPTVFTTALRTLLSDLASTARDGDTRTADQLYADVLMTLVTGPAALAPAAQLALGYDRPTFDEVGHYTIVDEPQNLAAKGIWDTIRALAAQLDLTFPDTPRAVVHVDATLETILDALHDRNGPVTDLDIHPPPEWFTNPATAGTPSESPPNGLAPPHTRTTHPCPREDAQIERRYRPATLRGAGEIPRDVLRQLTAYADLQRIITDPVTGQPLEVGVRRPSRKLRDAVINRDRTCRFPGCERPAATADLDHIDAWRDDAAAATQTSPTNLACLCREHHRAKHQLHWTPTMLPNGAIRWHNPLLDVTATT